MNILIAEPMAAAGIELLKAQPGWNVIISNPKEYLNSLPEAEALLVRSAVKVTKEVLEKAPKLRVIGRAGVGVDNVDLKAATAAGVVVMNTPGGNAVSVAEHTIAFMLAMARSVPQANASTKSGKWEKKKFLGNEVRGKTLGVFGLGSIGREVVKRARALEMRILGADPFVSPQIVADLDVELVEADRLFAESDYITLHMALTPETRNLLSREAFEKMKPGVRILNCARGEMVDQDALVEALKSGKVAGAALDVFTPEPVPADHPLLQLENVIATPHIAGSTEEAQEIVGVRIAEQVADYLRDGVAINAVNMPALTPEQYKALGPYIELSEKLGSLAGQIARGNPKIVRLIYSGKIGDSKTPLFRNAGLVGVLNRWLSHRATLVNAMQLAEQRALTVEEKHGIKIAHIDSITVEVETDLGVISVEGALVLGKPRLMQVDGIYCEAPLTGNLLYMQNQDVPGVIGHVGTVLGNNGVNIANFSLGRRDANGKKTGEPQDAIAVVETDGPVSDFVIAQLKLNPAVKVARSVDLG